MKETVQKFVSVFGLCVITASLCSGCASTKPVADAVDVNRFAMDCSRKHEQIAYLQSLRRSPDDILFSVSGWLGYDAQTNWLIDTQIRKLVNYC